MNILRNAWLQAPRPPLALQVLDSGLARVGPEWQYEGMCSSFNRLYYTVSGEGQVTYAGRTVALCPAHATLIPAGLTFDYGCAHAMEQLYFHINVLPGDGLELFRGHCQVLALAMPPGRMEALLTAYRSAAALDAFALLTGLQEDIVHFVRLAGLDGAALHGGTPFAAAVFAAVREGLSARLTIGRVAQALSLSESALARRFRQEAGLSLGRYIDGLLLQEAQRLLATTDCPIGEIAEALSFCDQFYFSRYFKQRLGETPSQYRRKHLPPM